jgi:hypothetical protein
MLPSRRRPAPGLATVVPALQPLLEAGHATRGLQIRVRGGQLILQRSEDTATGTLPDPRFRLTPLGGWGQYGLSLYRRRRWEPLPYQGTLEELVDVMNSDLQHWAAAWP